MRNRCSVWLWLLIFGAVCSAAQGVPDRQAAADPFLGTWVGSWEAAGSGGGFELTLEKDKDGGATGKVSVTGEPTYQASFTTLTLDGRKMSAKYDFTPDPGGEVVLAATFDGNKATGTWSLREKSSGNEVASGGWTVTKK